MFVVCCLLFAVWCVLCVVFDYYVFFSLLRVECWLLFVVCCLFVCWWLLCVVCCLLVVVNWLSLVGVCWLLLVVCCLLFVV